MKYIITLFLFLLNMNLAYSQVNIESLRSEKNGYDLELGASFLSQTGNNNVMSGDLSSVFHYRTENNYLFFKAEIAKGKQDKKYFIDNTFSHLRWTYMFSDIVGSELFTQFQQDKFKKLSLRQLNGFGLRAEIYKGEKDILSIGTAAMTDFEDVVEKTSLVIRSSSYVSFAHGFDKEKKSQILLVGYYQPVFVNPEDYRINAEFNLRSSLIETLNISLELTVVYLYDTNPPVDILTNDLIIKTGLLFKL